MTEPTNAEIRAWARDNGHPVAERGRIPGVVLAAYAAAHQESVEDLPVDDPEVDRASFDEPEPEVAVPTRTYAYAPPEQGLRPGEAPGDASSRTGAAPREPWTPSSGTPGPAQAPPPGPPPAWGAPPPPPPPSGYPPPPPSWGTPPSGQQWDRPGGPPGASSGRGRDGFAIAALVLGIIPILAGVLGIVFGVVALSRIRKSGRKGRGMAIAGIVLGVGWILAIAVATVVSVLGEADRAGDGSVTSRGSVTVDALRTGDCPTSLPDGIVRTIDLVPCSQPHRAEVYGTFTLTGPRFPGEEETTRLADGGCLERLISFVGKEREPQFEIYFLTPTSLTWATGDRTVQCLLARTDGALLPPGSAKAP